MNNELSALDTSEYRAWIGELKKRYRATQIKAAVSVNSALIEYYWRLGRDISEKYSEFTKSEIYGKQFFPQLSADLKAAMPGVAGHSPRNLRYCLDFFELYAGREFFPHIVGKGEEKILQQVVAKSPTGFSLRKDAESDSFCGENILQQFVAKLIHVPWGHHIVVIDKCKGDSEKAWFYACRTNEHGWSRNMLLNMLSTDLYEREGKVQTNFELTLPKPESDLAEQLICRDHNRILAQYMMDELKTPLGINDYELHRILPPVEKIQAALEEEGSKNA
ncbi:MAG: DUF1016 N-terminal domain-containing protein [Kiritimatiellae bacterium]|nr:DUF1016 N-terminal domain-containing protein [Kiritimatiellia bacterium]